MDPRVELIKANYRAIERGDLESVMATVTADAQYRNPPGAVEPGIRRGREAFAKALGKVLETFEFDRVDAEEIEETPRGLLVRLRTRVRTRGSATPIDQTFWHLIEMQDELVSRLEWFSDEASARRAASAED